MRTSTPARNPAHTVPVLPDWGARRLGGFDLGLAKARKTPRTARTPSRTDPPRLKAERGSQAARRAWRGPSDPANGGDANLRLKSSGKAFSSAIGARPDAQARPIVLFPPSATVLCSSTARIDRPVDTRGLHSLLPRPRQRSSHAQAEQQHSSRVSARCVARRSREAARSETSQGDLRAAGSWPPSWCPTWSTPPDLRARMRSNPS
jgi:hypothetical protein